MRPVILYLALAVIACYALVEASAAGCDEAKFKELDAEIEKVVGKKAWAKCMKEMETAEKKVHAVWDGFMKRIPKDQAKKINELDEKYKCHH